MAVRFNIVLGTLDLDTLGTRDFGFRYLIGDLDTLALGNWDLDTLGFEGVKRS